MPQDPLINNISLAPYRDVYIGISFLIFHIGLVIIHICSHTLVLIIRNKVTEQANIL